MFAQVEKLIMILGSVNKISGCQFWTVSAIFRNLSRPELYIIPSYIEYKP